MTKIATIQLRTFHDRILPSGSVDSQESCLAAVERLGYLWAFTPAPGYLPALFPALATESEHQRWEWVWGWKDRLAASRTAFYGKVVGGKPTLIAQSWLPQFYALTGNTGDPEDDLLRLRESGRVPDLVVKVHRYLEEYGPTSSRVLQAKLTDGSKEARGVLNQALFYLDRGLLIVKVGAEGGNSIANIWDLMPRAWPTAVAAGTEIATREAALTLWRHFLTLTPALPLKAVGEIFPWSPHWQEKALARLREAGELVDCTLNGKPGICSTAFRPD